ncbi:MAG: O-antigen ligase family protein, partial [Patescibacteria group bacterium]
RQMATIGKYYNFIPIIFHNDLWFTYHTPKVLFFYALIQGIFPFFCILHIQYKTARSNFKHPIIITLLLFVLVQIISALFGMDPFQSFFGKTLHMEGVIFWIHVLLFFFYLQLLFQIEPKSKIFILRFFLVIAGFTGLIAFLQKGSILPLPYESFQERVTATFSNPIYFASSLVIPFFLSLGLIPIHKSAWDRRFKIVIIILCFLGLLSAGTRGAAVGVIAGLITWLFLWIRSKHIQKQSWRKPIQYGMLFFVITILIVFLSHIQTNSNLSLSRFKNFTPDYARFAYWTMSLQGWKESPWFGVGPQNFEYIAYHHYTPALY